MKKGFSSLGKVVAFSLFLGVLFYALRNSLLSPKATPVTFAACQPVEPVEPLPVDSEKTVSPLPPDTSRIHSLSRSLCKIWALRYGIKPLNESSLTKAPSEVQSPWHSLNCPSFFRIRSEHYGGRQASKEIFNRDIDAGVVRKNNGTWIAFLTPMMSSPGRADSAELQGTDSLVFWRYLWKTFLETSAHHLAPGSNSYWYTFYIGVDHNDEGLEDPQIMQQIWNRMQRDLVTHGFDLSKVGLRAIVANDTAQSPSWMVSHLALEAFCADVDYFYQINDDVSMKSRDWEDQLIATLRSNGNIGATGPHDLYNDALFTQSFVHRNHVSIFHPYYFPPRFRNLYSDNWMTQVYRPLNSSFTQTNVTVLHEYEAVGQRYPSYSPPEHLAEELKKGEQRIRAWLQERSAWGDTATERLAGSQAVRQMDREGICQPHCLNNIKTNSSLDHRDTQSLCLTLENSASNF